MSYDRRGSIEIMLDIIKNTNQSLTKTKLMNITNLAHKPFKKYTDFLEHMGFMMKVPPPPRARNRRKSRKVKFHYENTNKGIELLNQISQKPLSDLLAYRNLDIMEEM